MTAEKPPDWRKIAADCAALSTGAVDALAAWWRGFTLPDRVVIVHPSRVDSVRDMVVRLDLPRLEVRGSERVDPGEAVVVPLDQIPPWAQS